ncbi:hypothetical protein ACQEVZ_40355, partial [Dactylosporangium sp. CA-152071]
DGAKILLRELRPDTDGRAGVALLPTADLRPLAGRRWLPPGKLPVLVVVASVGRLLVPVEDETGERLVTLTPEQMAQVTGVRIPPTAAMALLTCDDTIIPGMTARRFQAERRRQSGAEPVGDLLTVPDAIILGGSGGLLTTEHGRAWVLDTGGDLDGSGWDVVNDLNAFDFDGFFAASGTPDGLHLSVPAGHGAEGQLATLTHATFRHLSGPAQPARSSRDSVQCSRRCSAPAGWCRSFRGGCGCGRPTCQPHGSPRRSVRTR